LRKKYLNCHINYHAKKCGSYEDRSKVPLYLSTLDSKFNDNLIELNFNYLVVKKTN